MASKPLRQIQNLSQAKQLKVDITNPNVGLNNKHIVEAVPTLDKAPNSMVVQGEANALTIYGKDRPGTLGSGYGGAGATQCASIDHVVGLQAMAPGGPRSDTYVNPSMLMDAARIMISEMTDVDKNFGIVSGKLGDSKAQSAIAIKADSVRTVARSGGIKLVTGTDPMNSKGVSQFSTPGIELIAGNDDSKRKIIGFSQEVDNLQPIPKGQNLQIYLDKIMKRIDDLATVVDDLMKTQQNYNTVLQSHVHICTAPGAPSSPSIELLVATPLVGVARTAFAKIPNYLNRVNMSTTKMNYAKEFGSLNINSRYNRTT